MKPLQYKAFNTVSVSVPSGAGTAFSGVINDNANMPTGDLEIYEFYLRVYGTLSLTAGAAGTIVTNGNERFLRAFSLQTDKHQKIIDGVDGLGLYRIAQYRNGVAGARTALSAITTGSPTFTTDYQLPMSDKSYLRPYDSILDLQRSRPSLSFSFGSLSGGALDGTGDLISGGTYTVETISALSYQFAGRVLNGPIVEPGNPGGLMPETPEWMPHLELKKESITATATNYRIPLPYNDRIIRRVYISQRLSTTTEEVSTVITGTQNVGVEVNSFPWCDRMQNAQLQGLNKTKFQQETLPTGWTVIDFDETGRYPDMLSLIDRANGTANLVLDVTSVSNGQLYIYIESFKPIPDAALRENQLAARNAAR